MKPRSRWPLLAALGAVLAVALAALIWSLVPREPAARPRTFGSEAVTTAPAPVSAVDENPAFYLPPRIESGGLPRSYRDDRLGAGEDELKKAHALQPAPAHDPWTDLFRPVEGGPVAAVGYDTLDHRVCQLIVRYRPDLEYQAGQAVDRARKLYGEPQGRYEYRTRDAHEVVFWEDAESLVKIDALVDGGTRRLWSLHLMDKAASLERAARK